MAANLSFFLSFFLNSNYYYDIVDFRTLVSVFIMAYCRHYHNVSAQSTPSPCSSINHRVLRCIRCIYGVLFFKDSPCFELNQFLL